MKKALETLSPSLSKDFELTNQLFTKYYPIAKKLKPNLASDIVSAAEPLTGIGALTGAAFGHYTPLLGIAGETAARHIAKELLVNPHLQQISKKIVLAANQNKWGIVKKLSDIMADRLDKISPEFAKELKSLTEKQLLDFFGKKSDVSGKPQNK